MIRSVSALAGLVVACAGIGLFATVGGYVWSLRADVKKQAANLSGKAGAAGDVAERAIKFVREVVAQAEKDLDKAREETAKAPPAKPVNPLERMFARQASENLAGSVERAHGAIAVATDAVTVADATLDAISGDEFPELKQLLKINPEQVTATRSALGNASADLRQAKTVLGIPVTDSGLTPEQLNAVDDALRRAKQFTNDAERVVENARKRVGELRTLADVWTWRVAAGVTAACLLAAVGQVFLARFCWRTFRGQPA